MVYSYINFLGGKSIFFGVDKNLFPFKIRKESRPKIANVSKVGVIEEYFLNMVTSMWNKLPLYFKEARSFDRFKAKLDMFESFSVYV